MYKVKNIEIYSDNRIPQNYIIPSEYIYRKFLPVLELLDKKVNFEFYDHYFLTVYKPDEMDLLGMFILARYLKTKNERKKL